MPLFLSRLKTGLFLVLLSLVVLAGSANAQICQSATTVSANRPRGVTVTRATFQKQISEIAPKPNHVWRKTPDGWKQIPITPLPSIHKLKLRHQRPRLHPLAVASLTLLLSLAAMAWTSNEWDWERFVGRKKPDGDS